MNRLSPFFFIFLLLTACEKPSNIDNEYQHLSQAKESSSLIALAQSDISRHQLRGYIENNIGAATRKFNLKDNLGQSMDVLKVLQTDGKFVGVYHVNNNGSFSVWLATSTDLINWVGARIMSSPGEASMPDLYQSGNSYILAWEKEASPRQIVLRWFTNITNLYNNIDDGTRAVLSSPYGRWCGTPNIYSGNRSSVNVGFHYWDGRKDRNARGTTNWTYWTSHSLSPINDALQHWGCYGNIGARDFIEFNNYNFTATEGQFVYGDFASWRLYLFDNATNNADPITVRTPGSPNGTAGIANPKVSKIHINNKDAILVTAYIFSEGAALGESGPCIYYNYIE